MATKIKFNIFKFLFRLFSFLADKTGGWMLFVKPKLLLGTLIVGLGVTACAPKEKKAENVNNTENVKNTVSVLDTISVISDSISNKKINKVKVRALNTANQESNILCYVIVEQMPMFPGGEQALMDFLSENVHYPDSALEQGIEGKVTCRFAVEKDGSISNVEVLRKLNKQCDEEAIRVIKLMPKWIPGKQSGENVTVWFTVPITFRISKPTN